MRTFLIHDRKYGTRTYRQAETATAALEKDWAARNPGKPMPAVQYTAIYKDPSYDSGDGIRWTMSQPLKS